MVVGASQVTAASPIQSTRTAFNLPVRHAGHRVSRPRGTGSVGDSVGEGTGTESRDMRPRYSAALAYA